MMTERRRASLTGAALVAATLVGGLVAAAPPALGATSPGAITTVAGGVGRGPATKVFQVPQAVATGPGGAVYVADTLLVRKFTSTSSYENVFAGTATPGYSGNGGPAEHARLNDPQGLTVDGSGNLIIADTDNHRIRVVAATSGTFYGQAMTARHIYTIAGNGGFGDSGDGGPASSAKLESPAGSAVDAAGNIVFGDYGTHVVRVIAATSGTFYGQAMTAGDIYTIAGNGFAGSSGDGGPATSAELNAPEGVAVGPAGNIVIADSISNRVRVVAAKSGTFYGQAMTAGDIYTIAGNGDEGYSGDGGPGTSAELFSPIGVAADPAGNVAIADYLNGKVRVVAAKSGTFYGQAMTKGDIYTVAGSANLSDPEDVTFDAAGNLLIASNGRDRVSLLAARSGTFYGKAMTAGHLYIIAGDGSLGSSGSGGKAVNAEIFSADKYGGIARSNIAVDGQNYVVVSTNQAWFICETSGTYFGQVMTARDIYVVAGNGFKGDTGDGGPATSARFGTPGDVAVDASGNLVIADSGNNRVRLVAAKSGTFYGQAMKAGNVYTVAGDGTAGFSGEGGPAASAELNSPQGVAVDAAGNLVIADSGNDRVRVVAATSGTFYGQAMMAGDIYTVAGTGAAGSSGDRGPATSAKLRSPQDVAVDAAGNLVIADTDNEEIRVVAAEPGMFFGQVMTAGDIYAVAGNGTYGSSGNGGPATSAELAQPQGVAVDAAGNLVIAATANEEIRVVAAEPGTFYGQVMTAGDIYAVAGDGTQGFSGDGGPATSAELNDPEGVAVDSSGDLLIADTVNGRVRLVSG